MPRAQLVSVPGAHSTRGYAHAWRAGDLLFISGQVAMNPQGEVVGRGDMGAQAEQVFANLGRVLDAAGAAFRHVIKLTILCTDPAGIPAIREARNRALDGHTPASTLMVVAGLASPDYLVEVEAIAALPGTE
jgi:enamine deaminase RidA (YjgF/YER057c/UK114 family)